jgi:hypothetical protein
VDEPNLSGMNADMQQPPNSEDQKTPPLAPNNPSRWSSLFHWPRRVKRLVIFGICLVILGIGTGLLSTRICAGTCEKKLAKSLTSGLPGPFQAADGDTSAILQAAGIQVSPNAPMHIQLSRARSAGPFIIEVDFAAFTPPLGGYGGTARYFCVFGYAFGISSHLKWAS